MAINTIACLTNAATFGQAKPNFTWGKLWGDFWEPYT